MADKRNSVHSVTSDSTSNFCKTFQEKSITNVACIGAGHIGIGTIAVMAERYPLNFVFGSCLLFVF